MSQENVEVVRRIFRALAERDLDGVVSCWDPLGDYYPIAKWPEAQPRHGSEQILDFLIGFHQSFERVDHKIEAITPVGDDRVLVRVALAWEGKASGVSLGGEMFHCVWVRHGRVFRQEDHLSLPGALRALGLDGTTMEAAGLGE